MWKGSFDGKAKDMLELLAAEPRPFARTEIADRTNLDILGGTFRTYLGHLTAAGVVLKKGKQYQIAPELAL